MAKLRVHGEIWYKIQYIVHGNENIKDCKMALALMSDGAILQKTQIKDPATNRFMSGTWILQARKQFVSKDEARKRNEKIRARIKNLGWEII